MKEIPILFSTDMVKAILEGRKTQTRRFVKQIPRIAHTQEKTGEILNLNHDIAQSFCPYGQPGDLLWVRESFVNTFIPHTTPVGGIVYKADHPEDKSLRYKPSIHMPKAAARIWLQVEEIRVERLQDISEKDAIAEGVENLFTDDSIYFSPNSYKNYTWHGEGGDDSFSGYSNTDSAKESLQSLWYKTYGVESWNENPWVWVVKYKVLSTTGKPQNL